MRILSALLLILVMSFVPSAMAGSLVNPDFGSDLSGWDIFGPTVWDALDAEGSGSSGSVLLTHDETSGGGTISRGWQCLPVLPGEYSFGAKTYVPVGEPDVTAGRIVVFAYTSGDCSGDVAHFVVSSENVDQGAWTDTIGSITISAAEASAQFRLGISKGPPGVTEPGSVHLDNVYFESVTVFDDRFEQP